tara:strand:- start:765 stop:2075 length:1311 start_codon:yes stop_codon:yes gene_type:complete
MSNNIEHKKSPRNSFLTIDIITPLVKSKNFIISTSLIFMVLAGAYDLKKSPEFISSAVIEIGEIVDYTYPDAKRLMQEPGDLISELKIAFIHKPNVFSEKQVDNRNKFWERQDDLSFEVLEEKLIKITLTSNSEIFAKKSLEEIISYIISKHKKMANVEDKAILELKTRHKNQIREIQTEIEQINGVISFAYENYNNELSSELDVIYNEINQISAQINAQVKVRIEYLNSILPILDQKIQLLQTSVDSDNNSQNGSNGIGLTNDKDIQNNFDKFVNLSHEEKLLSIEIENEKNHAIRELELLNNSDFYKYATLTNNFTLTQQIINKDKLQIKLDKLNQVQLENKKAPNQNITFNGASVFEMQQKKDTLEKILRASNAQFEFDLNNLINKKTYSTELIGEILVTKISSNRTLIPFGFFIGLFFSVCIVLLLRRYRYT